MSGQSKVEATEREISSTLMSTHVLAFSALSYAYRLFLVLLGRVRFLDSLGEVLHGLLDAVSGLGTDGMQKCNATQIFLSRETEEVRKGLSRTRISGVVLVGKNTKQHTCIDDQGKQKIETARSRQCESLATFYAIRSKNRKLDF